MSSSISRDVQETWKSSWSDTLLPTRILNWDTSFTRKRSKEVHFWGVIGLLLWSSTGSSIDSPCPSISIIESSSKGGLDPLSNQPLQKRVGPFFHNNRLVDMLATMIPVPPTTIRPTVEMQNMRRNEDNLTIKLKSILYINRYDYNNHLEH